MQTTHLVKPPTGPGVSGFRGFGVSGFRGFGEGGPILQLKSRGSETLRVYVKIMCEYSVGRDKLTIWSSKFYS